MSRKDRNLDKTHLSIDAAEERKFIHRDYIAHCFRWSHVAKRLMQRSWYKRARVLDIGCGKEVPLMKMLYTNKTSPRMYLGVDPNKIPRTDFVEKLEQRTGFYLYDEAEYGELDLSKTPFEGSADCVVCFEVLEHVEPTRMFNMLAKIRSDLDINGSAFISTPCYDPTVGAAGNHINEITYWALGALLEDMGFSIVSMHGTFASQKDYLDEFITVYKCPELFDRLREYYDSNILSVIFAPLFPERSRNCIWEITPFQTPSYDRHFPTLEMVERPLTSHVKEESLLMLLKRYKEND